MPALLTIISSGPSAATAPSTARSSSAARATSARNATARAPFLVTSSAVSRAAASSRSTAATAAPRAPSMTAVARPMPEPAPVTTPCRSGFRSCEKLLHRPRRRVGRLVNQHVTAGQELDRRTLDASLPLLGVDHRIGAVGIPPQDQRGGRDTVQALAQALGGNGPDGLS